jgi:hypothetical protein
MERDDLGERLRRAGEADGATVDRVARVALAPGALDRGAVVRRPLLAVAAVCLAAVVAVGAWWSRGPTPPVGAVYRVRALPPEQEGAERAASPVPAPRGVYRATAESAVAPEDVIRITADDGTTWIVSTNVVDDGVPRGGAVVIGGEEAE